MDVMYLTILDGRIAGLMRILSQLQYGTKTMVFSHSQIRESSWIKDNQEIPVHLLTNDPAELYLSDLRGSPASAANEIMACTTAINPASLLSSPCKVKIGFPASLYSKNFLAA